MERKEIIHGERKRRVRESFPLREGGGKAMLGADGGNAARNIIQIELNNATLRIHRITRTYLISS